jgi:ferric-dicitrate binding protein FerR (iron transport regulator)
MTATLLTLATGRTLEVDMAYDDAVTYFAVSGQRAATLTDGRRIKLDTNLIQMTEEATTRQAVGFR